MPVHEVLVDPRTEEAGIDTSVDDSAVAAKRPEAMADSSGMKSRNSAGSGQRILSHQSSQRSKGIATRTTTEPKSYSLLVSSDA